MSRCGNLADVLKKYFYYSAGWHLLENIRVIILLMGSFIISVSFYT